MRGNGIPGGEESRPCGSPESRATNIVASGFTAYRRKKS